jgi:hypothetical protein
MFGRCKGVGVTLVSSDASDTEPMGEARAEGTAHFHDALAKAPRLFTRRHAATDAARASSAIGACIVDLQKCRRAGCHLALPY